MDTLPDGYQVVRVNAAAGIALVQHSTSNETRWLQWHQPAGRIEEQEDADDADDVDGATIHLQQAIADPLQHFAPSLDLKRSDFDPRAEFEVVPSADQLPVQNLVVFLHGRGDSRRPFARLGAQMALPQTAIISLQAPLELPFAMGRTWCNDLDDDFNVIPPSVSHPRRSKSLQAARDYVRSFLETLRDRYHWPLDRVSLFGFSQGASVAFHVALTLPWRLAGVVLIAGGAVNGPHASSGAGSVLASHETPALLICGGRDDVFPLSMADETERRYRARFPKQALFRRSLVANKTHDMVRSGDEMRAIMTFFSQHLYLRNVALETQSDLIEITSTGRQQNMRE